jgi:hypothetical protein
VRAGGDHDDYDRCSSSSGHSDDVYVIVGASCGCFAGGAAEGFFASGVSRVRAWALRFARWSRFERVERRV